MQSQKFEIIVDGMPVIVRSKPYEFNTETRFLVSYNGSEEYVFLWSAELSRLAAIGDHAVDIPVVIENAIAAKLQSINS